MMRAKWSLLLVILAAFLLAACRPAPAPVRSSPTPSQPAPTPAISSTATAVSSPPASPHINGFLAPPSVDGYDWPPNVDVTIQVYDRPRGHLIFTGIGKTGGDGHFVQGVGVTTIPGMAVAVTYGQETQSVVLVPLAITNIDPAGDTVSGTATNGARVFLYIGDSGQSAELWTTTSEAGQWRADFSGHYDITETTLVQATLPEASGNGTVFKTSPK
jgi:hypothetical protein